MTNEKILLQLEKGYDITNPQLAQALSNLETKISEGGGTDIPEELVSYLQNLNDKIYVCNSTDVVNQQLSSEVVNTISASAAIIFYDMGILLTKGGNTSLGPMFVAPMGSTNLRSWVLNTRTNFGGSIDLIPYKVADVVLYTPQTLTDAQQEQARTNIGAASASDVYDKYKEHGGSKMSEGLMYDELAAQLVENTVWIDSSQFNTTLDEALGNKVYNASTILLFVQGEILHFLRVPSFDSGYAIFYGIIHIDDSGICDISTMTYDNSTKILSEPTTKTIASPYAIYVANGGTNYASEASFNAAFVTVMDTQIEA